MKEYTEFKRKSNEKSDKEDRPISKIYPVIDNDLARDNIENDLTVADKQEL